MRNGVDEEMADRAAHFLARLKQNGVPHMESMSITSSYVSSLVSSAMFSKKLPDAPGDEPWKGK